MTKSEAKDSVSRLLSRPLCCKYAAVVFREVSFLCESDASPRAFLWGLGRLADGECEILGAWMTSGEGAAIPTQVFAELDERGVQSFKVLAGCSAIADDAGPFFDRAGHGAHGRHIIPLQGQLLRESAAVRSLRPATRKAVVAADRLVEDIQSRLNAMLARHGAFGGEADALGFVADFLARADLKLADLPVRHPVARLGLASAARAWSRA